MLFLSIYMVSKKAGSKTRAISRFMLLLSITRSSDKYAALTASTARQAHAWGRAFPEHFPTEAEELGRPAPGPARHAPGAFDQALAFDQTAEILLVQTDAGESFDGALQLKQRKFGRHQLEDDGTIFHLAAQPSHGGGKNAPMIEHHVGT